MISGRPVRTFLEANCACMVDVSMNGDYDFFYAIEKVDGGIITVSRGEKKIDALIQKERGGAEFFVVRHNGIWSKLSGAPPEKIKCYPFLDKGGEFREHIPFKERR